MSVPNGQGQLPAVNWRAGSGRRVKRPEQVTEPNQQQCPLGNVPVRQNVTKVTAMVLHGARVCKPGTVIVEVVQAET